MCWQLVLWEAHRGEGKERGTLRVVGGNEKHRGIKHGHWTVSFGFVIKGPCTIVAVHTKLDCVLNLRWILDIFINHNSFSPPSYIVLFSKIVFASESISLSITGSLNNLFLSKTLENVEKKKLWLGSTCFRPDTFIIWSKNCSFDV